MNANHEYQLQRALRAFEDLYRTTVEAMDGQASPSSVFEDAEEWAIDAVVVLGIYAGRGSYEAGTHEIVDDIMATAFVASTDDVGQATSLLAAGLERIMLGGEQVELRRW